MNGSIEVVRSGSMTTLQDTGRSGFAHLAVPVSGALDQPALRLANRLVGNEESAACLETTMDGVAIRALRGCHAAVTGAVGPVTRDGEQVGWALPIRLRAGQVLDVGRATHGVRSYVAVSGGFDSPQVLGSRATDLLSGLGPPVLRVGDVLPLGRTHRAPPAIDFAPYRVPGERSVTLQLYPGPRAGWLTTESANRLVNGTWTVTSDGNRVGVRLDGPPLARSVSAELASEGVVLGSVQVPNDGRPVIFLADHPTTGGYPVVAVVSPQDLHYCAQARPGTIVRFAPVR